MTVYVDYLTVTWADTSAIGKAMMDMCSESAIWRILNLAPQDKNITGFGGKMVRSEEHGHIFIGMRAYDRRVMLQTSGYFSHVWAMMLLYLEDIEGMNIPRIDLQFTGVAENGTSFDAEIMIKAAHVLTLSYIKTQHFGSPYKVTKIASNTGGSTLYIGSRQSEWMIRVYNKGAQADWPVPAVRYEVEIKGDKAKQVWGTMRGCAEEKRSCAVAAMASARTFVNPAISLGQSFIDALDGRLDLIIAGDMGHVLDSFFVARGINLTAIRGAEWAGHHPVVRRRGYEEFPWKDASMVWLQRQVSNTVKRLAACGLDAQVRTWFEDAFTAGMNQSERDDGINDGSVTDIDSGPFRDSFELGDIY